ncbi:MAG: hypothetical protein PVG94_03005, partial [Gammaproteobacteria bacterium]
GFLVEADVLYSYINGRFRLLGEYILSTEESELERLQLGWQIGEQSIGWIGRFHSPSRYWNEAYHHGQYLQTTITRPNIEQYEDFSGFLPTHISGLLAETSIKPGNAKDYQIVFSLGAAPTIGNNQLKPFDFLGDDNDPDHGAAGNLRLSYLPDQFDNNQVGLILSWSHLMIDDSQTAVQQGLRDVDQYTVGAYLDWRLEKLKLLSSLIQVRNEMHLQNRNETDAFISGYLQSEYELEQDLTVFGRLEGTSNIEDSSYLELFPNSILERKMLGVRFDIFKQHAIKIEFSRVTTRSSDFDQMMLQWSAVLP